MLKNTCFSLAGYVKDVTKNSNSKSILPFENPQIFSSYSAMTILEELISPLSLVEFQQNYLCKAPYAAPFVARRFVYSDFWPVLTEIFGRGHNDCWLPHQGRLPAEKELCTGVLNTAQAKAAFQQGRTVLVRHAEKAHKDMGNIWADFGKLFNAPIDIQLYCTPSGEEGFDWHYDIEDVFVLQSHGEKEFRLKLNTITARPLPAKLPKDLCFEKELSRTETRCLLKAGDWLYIPAGYWHKARAIHSSFHISVGVRSSLPGVSGSLSCQSDAVFSY